MRLQTRPPEPSEQTAPQEPPGELLSGRYRIEAQLGVGGMASVWSARDEVLNRRVALKRLSKASLGGHVALFEREFHTLASLRHASIIQVYDYATDANGPYYTMELLDGSDVSDLAPMSWPEVCRILRDVASALALLHARRLLHRDVSARNVWLTVERQIRLIDFGAMAAFGKAGDVAGTPPFIAPESLHGPDIDQRADLYALGALGYFLLSGRHAYPAQSLAALEAMWRQRPAPISQRVSELERPDLPAVPVALEALLASLLSQERLARPTTAADVIDRLNVIASLDPDTQVRALDSYLCSPAFVGRHEERRVLRTALSRIMSGSPLSVVIEAAAGLGRTRLLTEFALEARLAGAIVLRSEARRDGKTLGVAIDVAMELIAALPEASAFAAPYAATLGHLDPQLRARLAIRPEDLCVMPQAFGEARQRIQSALRDWFLDVGRKHPIVVVADDVDAYDEGSAAWLASLARDERARSLGVIAALRSDHAPFGLAVHALCQGAQRISLVPLAQDETAQLFRSVFGDVPHLARFVDRIHQRSQGNVGLAIELAEYLGRAGVIAYAAGAWVLPQELTDEMLPASRFDAEKARLERLPESTRALGQVLSVGEGQISLELCAALAETDGQALFDGIEALVREGILTGSANGYRFSRESFRDALLAGLSESRGREAHRRLGRFLLRIEGAAPLDRLKAGVHLLQGGEEDLGSLIVAAAAKHYGLVDLADLGPAWPSLEKALALFRAAGRSPHEMASLLPPLALAGYYADRRLAERHGRDAVELLQALVGLKLARRLRFLLGRKLSLFVGLAVGAVGFLARRRNPRIPTFREAMMMLFNCVVALTGVCTISSDPEGGERYAAVIEPLTVLGPDHVASFMHEFCRNLSGTIRDRLTEARANWNRMMERLDRPEILKELPPHIHVLYLAGALYAAGVIESLREDGRELEMADRLDAFKLKLYELSADQLRMMHYGNRGDLPRFEHYRARVEMHAIQRGTAWQVETWTFGQLTNIYLRWGYVAGLKECTEQLKRLSAEVRSLQHYYRRSVGAYLLLRGSPKEALEWLGRDEKPLERVGWARGEATRARAHNELGEHALARQTCIRTLELLNPGDLEFSVMNAGLELELARAEAGLGKPSEAEQRLRALLIRYKNSADPLTIGPIYEALADLAAARDDIPAVEAALRELEKWFAASRNPSLVARYTRLLRVLAELRGDVKQGTADQSPHMLTLVHALRHGGDDSPQGSARWALGQLSRYAGVTNAYLFSVEGEDVHCIAQIGECTPASTELVYWVAERLRTLTDSDEMVTRTASSEDAQNSFAIEGSLLHLTPLLLVGRPENGNDPVQQVVGAIVTPATSPLPFDVLKLIAERIGSTARGAVAAD